MKELPLRPQPPRRAGALRYALLAVGVLVAALAGYLGYVLYPRFDLPGVAGTALLALAAAAGVASFFSPCSFPLLLTLLARHAHARGGGGVAMVPFAAAFGFGVVAFLLLLGAVVGLVGRGIAASVTFTSPAGIAIRFVVGALLLFLGLVQAEIVPLSFHPVERRLRPLSEAQAAFRRRHPVAGLMAFGFFYVLIGFG